MKKALSFVLVGLFLSAALAFASGQKDQGSASGASGGATVQIGYILAGPDDYYKKGEQTFRALAERQGWKVTTVSSEYKPEKELANVNDFIVKKVNAIVLCTANSDTGAQAAKLANDANIPIFFITAIPNPNGPGKPDGWAGYNWVSVGKVVGDYVGKTYPNSKSITIDGFYGQGTTEAIKQGYEAGLKEMSGGKAQYLGGNTGEWQRTKAIPVMQDYLASGKDFSVIFAMNEEMAAGVIQVLKEQGVTGKYKVVSQNGKEDAWQWLKAGTLDATVSSAPTLEADQVFQQVQAKLAGEPYPKKVEAKSMLLTKANVDSAVPWNTAAYMAARDAGKIDYKMADQNVMK